MKIKLYKRVWITIADPALAHKVLTTHGAQASYRPHMNFSYRLFSGGGNNIGFGQPGEIWNRNRAAGGADLVQRLLDYAERDGTVDPLNHLKLNYLNCIFGKCFGRTFKSIEDEEFLVITGMVEDTMKFLAVEADLTNYFPFLESFDFLNGGIVNKMRELMNKRHPLFMQYVKEIESKEGHNFVKALNEGEFNFSDDDKVLFLFEMVVAGSDNLAITTEVMRWRSATFFGISHSVIEDLVVDGYLFPKDSIINVTMISVHMDSHFYKNPEEFSPERYLPNVKSLHAAASGKFEERDTFVFGFGRRLCPRHTFNKCY
ncbi:uncharacterized protein ATC70_004409 [Mucor velutinosus]|uniref:Cytochrome P450 n=1 Tax=Mucor velutinosus TaxID=708070 RepID=A0AAN7I523_9FUNG|nr:hypothetical protein ATC70_004409 [Mucor velutinosus]